MDPAALCFSAVRLSVRVQAEAFFDRRLVDDAL